MKLFVHALPNDERVKAYVGRRKEAEPELEVEQASRDGAVPVEPSQAGEFEALISAELPNATALAADYVSQGVKMTILGKKAAEPEPKRARRSDVEK